MTLWSAKIQQHREKPCSGEEILLVHYKMNDNSTKKKKTLSKFVETRKNVKVRDRRSDTLQGMIYTFNMIFRMVCLVTFYSVGYGPDSFVVRIALRWLCVWLGFE